MHGPKLLSVLLAVVTMASACGGGGDEPDRPTTTTLAPVARAAGVEVCNALFADPRTIPSLERAREAGPQLGRIIEDLEALQAEDAAGTVTREEVVDRLTTTLEAFEIVCQDTYGVPTPPDYLDLS